MNFKYIFLLFLIFKSSLVFGEPNVLKCTKNCGISDLNNNYSFQARIAMGPDMWGGNVTFIEDDVILSQGHILGYTPEEKNSIPRCGSDASSNPAADWLNNKSDMFCFVLYICLIIDSSLSFVYCCCNNICDSYICFMKKIEIYSKT